MIRRKYTKEAINKLDSAIYNNDLDKVKKLIESGEAGITNLNFAFVVHKNHKEILKYFLEKETDAIAVIDFGLNIAIKDKNLEFVELIVQELRDNKNSKYSRQNTDSVIAGAIYKVGYCYSAQILTEEEMLKYAKSIIDIYCH